MASFRRRRRALAVGILDAQDEGAAMVARQQPVEQGRARIADVQVAGRAGSEANPHGRGSGPGASGLGSACGADEQRDGVAGHRLAAADAVDALVGLALDADRATSTPSAAASLARIASRYGRSFGRWAITVTSTLPTRKPAAATRATAPEAGARCCRRPSTRRRCRERAGRCRRARPRRAPRRSRAWQTMSASEWPSRPRSNGTSTPASTSRRPGTRRCRS